MATGADCAQGSGLSNAGDMRQRFKLWVGKIPWSKKWQPTPEFLPGESPWTEEPGGLQSVRP